MTMISFNTQTGELFSGAKAVNDAMVISHLSEELTLLPGTEDHLSLNSLKMMLTRYPALTQLSLRTQRFLKEASVTKGKRKFKALDYLELRKTKLVQFSELTFAGVDWAKDDQPSAAPGMQCGAFQIRYEDKPSKKVECGVYLDGRKQGDERKLSLIGYSVAQLLHLPISIRHAQIETIQTFANAKRDDLDYLRLQRDSYFEASPCLTLMEMIETIMIELTLC
jgi:hypothetical protein